MALLVTQNYHHKKCFVLWNHYHQCTKKSRPIENDKCRKFKSLYETCQVLCDENGEKCHYYTEILTNLSKD